MKNRKLSEFLKKPNRTAEEVGRFILKVNIDKVNKHTIDSDNTPILTDKVLALLFKDLTSSAKTLNIIATYQSLSGALASISNYSQSLYQQGLFAYYKILGELRVSGKSSESFHIIESLPLALTREELNATKKKSFETVRNREISLAEAWLGGIKKFFDIYSNGPKQTKIEKALDTVITDAYLCGLRCNQDIVSDGGVHFGLDVEDEKTNKALMEETKKNILKAHNIKTEKALGEAIYRRAQILIREIFENPQAFLCRFPEGAFSPSDIIEIFRSIYGVFSSALYSVVLNVKHYSANPFVIGFENYAINVKASARWKDTASKLVLEQIFGCEPLKYHYAQYKKGLTVRGVLNRLIESTGNTQEGFDAFLRYIDCLEPLFIGKEGKALFKKLKDSSATAKAYSTIYTVGELADKKDIYCLDLLENAISQKSIIEQFKKDNPKDPRALYDFSMYQVWDNPVDSAVKACSRAKFNELDIYWKYPGTGQKIRKTTVELLAYACRVLILCKKYLEEFALIYNEPELATAKITCWKDMRLKLDGLTFNILYALAFVSGNEELAEKRIKSTLQAFLPLCVDFLETDEEDFKASLDIVRKNPYGKDAQHILETITDVIQARALSDNRRKWSAKNQEGES